MFTLYYNPNYIWIQPNPDHPFHSSRDHIRHYTFTPAPDSSLPIITPTTGSFSSPSIDDHLNYCILIQRSSQMIVFIDRNTGITLMDSYLIQLFQLHPYLKELQSSSTGFGLPVWPLPTENTTKRDIYGIIGLHRMVRGLYLTFATQIESKVNILGRTVYRVVSADTLCLSNNQIYDDLNRSALLIDEELEALNHLTQAIASLSLHCSYSYDITLSLQKAYDFAVLNMEQTKKQQPLAPSSSSLSPNNQSEKTTQSVCTLMGDLISRAEDDYFTNRPALSTLFNEVCFTYRSLLSQYLRQCKNNSDQTQQQQENAKRLPTGDFPLCISYPMPSSSSTLPSSQPISSILSLFTLVCSHSYIHTAHHIPSSNHETTPSLTKYTIILRIGRHRSGARVASRGIDLVGKAGNMCQTEIVVEKFHPSNQSISSQSSLNLPSIAMHHNSKTLTLSSVGSYIMLRGSPPILHEQRHTALSALLLSPLSFDCIDNFKDLQDKSAILRALTTQQNHRAIEFKQPPRWNNDTNLMHLIFAHYNGLIRTHFPPFAINLRHTSLTHRLSQFSQTLDAKRFIWNNDRVCISSIMHSEKQRSTSLLSWILDELAKEDTPAGGNIERLVSTTTIFNPNDEPLIRTISLLGSYSSSKAPHQTYEFQLNGDRDDRKTTLMANKQHADISVRDVPLLSVGTNITGSASDVNSRIQYSLRQYHNFQQNANSAALSSLKKSNAAKDNANDAAAKDNGDDKTHEDDDDILANQSEAVATLVSIPLLASGIYHTISGLTHVTSRDGVFLALNKAVYTSNPSSASETSGVKSHSTANTTTITYMLPTQTSSSTSSQCVNLILHYPSCEDMIVPMKQTTISRINCMDSIDRTGRATSIVFSRIVELLAYYSQQFHTHLSTQPRSQEPSLSDDKLALLSASLGQVYRDQGILQSLGIESSYGTSIISQLLNTSRGGKSSPSESLQDQVVSSPRPLGVITNEIIFELARQVCNEFSLFATETTMLDNLTWDEFLSHRAKLRSYLPLPIDEPEEKQEIYTTITRDSEYPEQLRIAMTHYQHHGLNTKAKQAQLLASTHDVVYLHPRNTIPWAVYGDAHANTLLNSLQLSHLGPSVPDNSAPCQTQAIIPVNKLHFAYNYHPPYISALPGLAYANTGEIVMYRDDLLHVDKGRTPSYDDLVKQSDATTLPNWLVFQPASQLQQLIIMMMSILFTSTLGVIGSFYTTIRDYFWTVNVIKHLKRRFTDVYSFSRKMDGLTLFSTLYRPTRSLLPFSGYMIRQVDEKDQEQEEEAPIEQTGQQKQPRFAMYRLPESPTNRQFGFAVPCLMTGGMLLVFLGIMLVVAYVLTLPHYQPFDTLYQHTYDLQALNTTLSSLDDDTLSLQKPISNDILQQTLFHGKNVTTINSEMYVDEFIHRFLVKPQVTSDDSDAPLAAENNSTPVVARVIDIEQYYNNKQYVNELFQRYPTLYGHFSSQAHSSLSTFLFNKVLTPLPRSPLAVQQCVINVITYHYLPEFEQTHERQTLQILHKLNPGQQWKSTDNVPHSIISQHQANADRPMTQYESSYALLLQLQEAQDVLDVDFMNLAALTGTYFDQVCAIHTLVRPATQSDIDHIQTIHVKMASLLNTFTLKQPTTTTQGSYVLVGSGLQQRFYLSIFTYSWKTLLCILCLLAITTMVTSVITMFPRLRDQRRIFPELFVTPMDFGPPMYQAKQTHPTTTHEQPAINKDN